MLVPAVAAGRSWCRRGPVGLAGWSCLTARGPGPDDGGCTSRHRMARRVTVEARSAREWVALMLCTALVSAGHRITGLPLHPEGRSCTIRGQRSAPAKAGTTGAPAVDLSVPARPSAFMGGPFGGRASRVCWLVSSPRCLRRARRPGAAGDVGPADEGDDPGVEVRPAAQVRAGVAARELQRPDDGRGWYGCRLRGRWAWLRCPSGLYMRAQLRLVVGAGGPRGAGDAGPRGSDDGGAEALQQSCEGFSVGIAGVRWGFFLPEGVVGCGVVPGRVVPGGDT